MSDYQWPDTGDDCWGECECCELVHPLVDGLCKGCTEDAEARKIDAAYENRKDGFVFTRDMHAEAERDAKRDDELFTDEDFTAIAMEGGKE